MNYVNYLSNSLINQPPHFYPNTGPGHDQIKKSQTPLEKGTHLHKNLHRSLQLFHFHNQCKNFIIVTISKPLRFDPGIYWPILSYLIKILEKVLFEARTPKCTINAFQFLFHKELSITHHLHYQPHPNQQ